MMISYNTIYDHLILFHNNIICLCIEYFRFFLTCFKNDLWFIINEIKNLHYILKIPVFKKYLQRLSQVLLILI